MRVGAVTTLVEDDVYAGLSEAATALYKRVGFLPTGPEQRVILASRKRKIGLSGGEGAGKSVTASKIWLGRWPDDMAANPTYGDGVGDPLLYWLVGEDYSQVEAEFHYIEMDLLELGYPVDASSRVDPGHIKLQLPKDRNPILVIETKSARDPSRLTRQRPHGILHCEPGLSTVATYERLNGRIAGVRGWLALIGTLEGSMGWYPQLLQAWALGHGDEQSFRLPSWTNTYYYPGGRQDPEILRLERESSDQYFLERISGEVVPPLGLVIDEFRADLHIRDVQWDLDYPVYMCEDPGYGAHSAHALVLYQNIDHQIRVFDLIYERGMITQEIIRVAQRRDWWKAAKKQLVIDPHYKDQHHATHSVSDIWRLSDAGITPEANERVPVGPGIERLKGYFKPDPISGEPGIVIAPHLQGLLSELGAALDPFDNKSYHPWKWKEDRTGQIVGMEPLDEYNHALKALIYSIVHNFGFAYAQEKRIGKVTRRRKTEPNPSNPLAGSTQGDNFASVRRRR